MFVFWLLNLFRIAIFGFLACNFAYNLDVSRCLLYIVHMKTVKASEARKHWFRLLDDALRGEVIAVVRRGERIVLRREELNDTRTAKNSTQYKKLLRVPRADEADQWSWEWRPGRGVGLRRRSAR